MSDKKNNNGIEKGNKPITYIPIGVLFGTAFGIITENLTLGISLDIVIGAAMDCRNRRKNKE